MSFSVNPNTGNPVPTITGLNPSSATPGGGGFTLTVNGTNFISSSVVRWKGADRTTTYVSSTKLTAAILASDIAAAGSASVTVFNPAPGGGLSNAVSFLVSTSKKVYLPLVVKIPPVSGPTPGFWQSSGGAMEFYVTSNRGYVDDFAIYVDVSGCGRYKITHLIQEPISGNSFSFTGPFYASGTFSSQTASSGTTGLSNHLYLRMRLMLLAARGIGRPIGSTAFNRRQLTRRRRIRSIPQIRALHSRLPASSR